jgi:ligand-binding SRPBCC domain-containing protein
MYHPNWNAAGSNSYWRHVRNCTNHDSYGIRLEQIQYPTNKNPATDYFGNKNAIYSIKLVFAMFNY